MGYLSSHILKHSATYTPLNKQNIDGYGTLKKDEAVTLSKVYITRYTSQVITNNNLIVPFGDMLLFVITCLCIVTGKQIGRAHV